MKRLIINADEFGESSDANKAVSALYGEGNITNAAMLMNTDFTEEAIRLAKNNGIKCGVHLNLTFGRPLSSPSDVKSLVGKKGCFYSQFEFVARYIFGFVDINEVEKEFRAQVKRMHDNGIKPTHFDGHCYIHMLPGILNAAIKIAVEYKIDKTRLACEEWSFKSHGLRSLVTYNFLIRYVFVRLLKNEAKSILGKNNIKYPEKFHGIFLIGSSRFRDEFLDIVNNIGDRSNEVMVHPSLAGKRRAEYDTLKSNELKEIITNNKIELISYVEL